MSEPGLRIERDRSAQVLELDCRAPIFARDKPLVGSLAQSDSPGGFVSAAALARKAKQFDDGLYAAVELAVFRGTRARRARPDWLRALRETLGTEPAAVPLHAAQRMLDSDASVPAPLMEAVDRTTNAFLADGLACEPISFYGWTPELARLFRHDRVLQRELDPPQVDALIRALHGSRDVRTEYERHLELIERLTGPLRDDGIRAALRDLDEGRQPTVAPAALFPPAVSHETQLAHRRYGSRPVPDDFDLIEAVVEAVRSGSIDLGPTPESGWLDHQIASLEPMLCPETTSEARRLRFSDEYRRHLRELAAGSWALIRETHAKQAQTVRLGMTMPPPSVRPQVSVVPELSCEPVVSHYRRRADCYRFVRVVIEQYLGADVLPSMQRLTIDGAVEEHLDEELDGMIRLFDGMADRCEREIGASLHSTDAANAPSDAWSPQDDPDLRRDVRMMVPIFHDIERQKTKVWAVLGWAEEVLLASFATPPDIVVRDREGRDVTAICNVSFDSDAYRVHTIVMAEVYVDRILDREAFRELCDRHGTREEIVAALEGTTDR